MTHRERPSTSRPASVRVEGSLSLFGFPPAPMEAQVVPRSRRWRGLRLGGFLLGGLILAPVVGLVPPHAPWAVGALGLGAFFGIRKWRETLTLVSFSGSCPKCDSPSVLKEGIAVRPGMSVPCSQCHHDSILRLDPNP